MIFFIIVSPTVKLYSVSHLTRGYKGPGFKYQGDQVLHVNTVNFISPTLQAFQALFSKTVHCSWTPSIAAFAILLRIQKQKNKMKNNSKVTYLTII